MIMPKDKAQRKPSSDFQGKGKVRKTENLISWRRSIYVSATISLVTHYHNIYGKAFILTEHYKIFSSNELLEFLL